MDRDPTTDPREDDWLTCADGDIRVDRVHGGWVYFVSWKAGEEAGVPRRMEMATWTKATRAKGMMRRNEA